jgi:hypothetical protein
MVRDAWDRYALLTLRDKCSLLVFGAVMHLAMLSQLVLVSWMLVMIFAWLRST